MVRAVVFERCRWCAGFRVGWVCGSGIAVRVTVVVFHVVVVDFLASRGGIQGDGRRWGGGVCIVCWSWSGWLLVGIAREGFGLIRDIRIVRDGVCRRECWDCRCWSWTLAFALVVMVVVVIFVTRSERKTAEFVVS